MDIVTALKRAGLNEKQAAVYAAALRLGEGHMSELAKAALMKRSTAYVIATELLMLGLLSETKKGKRKVYAAVHPRRLLEIVHGREQQMQEALPELAAIYNEPKHRPKIQVFEGNQGFELLYRDLLNVLGEQREAMGFVNMEEFKQRFPEVYREFYRVYSGLKHITVRELHVDSPATRQWVREAKKRQFLHCQLRVLPKGYVFGLTDTFIVGSKLYIFSFAKELFVTVIEDVNITQTFRAMFEAAWTQGK